MAPPPRRPHARRSIASRFAHGSGEWRRVSNLGLVSSCRTSAARVGSERYSVMLPSQMRSMASFMTNSGTWNHSRGETGLPKRSVMPCGLGHIQPAGGDRADHRSPLPPSTGRASHSCGGQGGKGEECGAGDLPAWPTLASWCRLPARTMQLRGLGRTPAAQDHTDDSEPRREHGQTGGFRNHGAAG